MPSNYVVMDAQEMEYLEGGFELTSRQSKDIVAALGFASAQSLMNLAYAANTIRLITSWAKGFGPAGWLVGLAAGVLSTALGKVAYGIGYSAASGRTVVIEFTPAPWEAFVNVYWK